MDKNNKKEELKKIVRSRIKGLGLDALFHQVDVSKKDELSEKKEAVSEEDKRLLERLKRIDFPKKKRLISLAIQYIKEYLTPFSGNRLIIDIGESSIKAIEAKEVKNKIIIMSLFYKSIPYLLRENSVKKEEFVKETLEELASFSSSKDIISIIPSAKVILKFLTLPTTGEKEIRKMLEFEIKDLLPLPTEMMEIDWQVIKQKEGKSTVILTAIKKEEIEHHLNFLGKLKIVPSKIEVSSIALYNSLDLDKERKHNIIQVSIGEKNTEINILREGELILSRCLEWGSKDLTYSIAESLNLSFDNAEKIKKENGIVLSRKEKNSTSKTVSYNACRWVDYLVEEIKRSLTYLKVKENSPLDIDKLILSGGGANLINISDYLKEKLKMRISFLKPPQYIEIAPNQNLYNKYPLEFAPLMGGVLEKKESCFIKINLLPQRLKSSFRMEKTRTKLILLLCIMLGIVISLLMSTSIILNKKRNKIKAQKQKIEALSLKVKNVQQLKEKIRNIQSYISLEKSCMEVLREISLIATSDITINKFLFEKDRMVILEGEASSHSSVVNFSKNLSESTLFENAQIKYTKRKERLKEKVVFEITCIIK